MAAPRECPDCHAPLPRGAVEDLCPACMLEGALHIGAKVGLEVHFPSSGAPLSRIGDYQMLEEIARGGMGVVYRAKQISLNRIVAVKMIVLGAFADELTIRRFKTEAAAAAKLRHPNIVSIHEIGEENGQHFFSMEYIEGANLADFIRKRTMTIEQTAQLLKTTSEAVHYAHERGIIHRDLKPSNILIDCFLAPHITDFGIARDLHSDGELTVTGELLGSPNYISPEQATGKASGIATDIYALGAMLYHVLASRPPFTSDTITRTLQQVANDNPISPRLLNPSVPRDLETICLKCLEKEASSRYASARALAEELDRFIKDEPIQARPISLSARAWRWCRKRPALAGVAAAFVLSVLLGITGVFWQWQNAERNLYFSTMRRVQDEIEQESIGHAKTLLQKYIPKWWSKDLRGWEWYYAWEQCRGDELFSATNGFAMHSVAVSPDGRLLAAGGGGPVQLWDISKNRKVTERGLKQTVRSLVFSNDGKEIVAGLSDGRVVIWNIETQRTNTVLTNVSGVRSLRISPDGKLLAVYTHDGLTLWNAGSYERIIDFPGTQNTDNLPAGIAFSQDSRLLAYAREGGPVTLWDTVERSDLSLFEGHEQSVTALVFSADGSTLVSGSRDRTVRVWNVKSGKSIKTIGGFIAFVTSVDLSADGGMLAIAGAGQRLRVFETVSWQPITFLTGHTAAPRAITFSPNGRNIFSVDNAGAVKFWPASRFANTRSYRLPVENSQLLQRGRGVYLEYTNGTYSFWRAEEGQSSPPREFPSRKSGARAMSPDGRLFVIAATNVAQVFAEGTHKLIYELPAAASGAKHIDFSADSRFLAVCGNDQVARIWKLDMGGLPSAQRAPRLLATFKLRPGPIWNVRFSPRGRLFGVTYEGSEVAEIWNLASKTKVDLRIVSGVSIDMAFTTDESMALTSCGGGALAVWDPQTGHLVTSLGGQLGTLWSVALSPDETRIAACGGDGSVRIWDRKTLEEVFAERLHNERLYQLAFSENGEVLFVRGHDSRGSCRLFQLRAPRIADR